VLSVCDPKPFAKIFFSHPSKVQLFTFFATPPIKTETKDCKLVGTKLPIANHLDQSLLCLGNQRQGESNSQIIIYYLLRSSSSSCTGLLAAPLFNSSQQTKHLSETNFLS
jgi:hypothetical protein